MRVREENECTVFVVVDRRKEDREERWESECKSDECKIEFESLGARVTKNQRIVRRLAAGCIAELLPGLEMWWGPN